MSSIWDSGFNAPKGSFCISPKKHCATGLLVLAVFQCPEGLILYFTLIL